MDQLTSAAADRGTAAFFAIVRNPLKFRLYLLRSLPAAFFSGVRVRSVTEDACQVVVPFQWFTPNPFRCTYFACLSMAAEMSTGVLAMAYCYRRKPAVSMLLVGNEARYYKRATGTTRFVCAGGREVSSAVERALQSGAGETVRVLSTGYNREGEVVAEFWFTWSFRSKS